MQEKELFDLTNPQKTIWLTEQYFSNTAVNNICASGTIYEKIDETLLKKAINDVVKQNDSFRIRIVLDNNTPKQYISKYKSFNVETVYVSNEEELKKVKEEEAKKGFDLLDSNLFRFKIAIQNSSCATVILTANHMIADSWSMGITIKEFIKSYHSLQNNTKYKCETFPYIEYINSEKEYKYSKKFKEDQEYWNNILKTLPEQVSIPSLNSNSRDLSFSAKRLSFDLDLKTCKEINSFCKSNNFSAFNFFMAVFSLYVGRVANSNDFIIGSPILNRVNFKDKHTIGMFVNTVPVRINLLDDMLFRDLSKYLSQNMKGALRHQKYSYNAILEDLRNNNRNIPNLYNILFSYQVTKSVSDSIGNYETDWTFSGDSGNDFSIHIYDFNDTGKLVVNYDFLIDKYSDNEISLIHDRILSILNQIFKNPDISVNEIEVTTKKEKNQILNIFNKPSSSCLISKYDIIKAFEKQSKRLPNKNAIIFQNKQISYKELNDKSNQLARLLLEKGVSAGDVVGIMINRSIEMILAILAVEKCGAVYLPIDPEYPSDRIVYMLENSESKFILTNNKTKHILDSFTEIPKIEIININTPSIYQNNSIENLSIKTLENTVAYLIYTSGSTGKPKGVLVSRENLNNFVFGMKKLIDFNEDKTLVSVTTMCFDIFGLELWCSLTSGMTLVLANEEEQNSPFLLNKLCLDNNVNIIQTTPSRFSILLEDSNNTNFLKNITDLLVGGESVPDVLIKEIKKYTDSKIYNMYGPTETTIWSTVKDLTNSDTITIGTPIVNTQCYILDKNQKLLPPNVVGELYIGGKGVSLGYLKREDLTSEKFIISPFDKKQKIYNTNDLAYFTNNGELVHLGRSDSQVKIRGFRIELGEIESIILKNNTVLQCAVIKKELDNNHDVLIAYYTSSSSNDITNELKMDLNQNLPNYMIPHQFIKIEKMPYTPNGKIDRKSLFNLKIEYKKKALIKPRNEMDISLINILSEILKIKQISLNDSLMSLGGDSLSAISLSTKILSKYGVQLSIKELLSDYTVEELSDFIQDNMSKNNSHTKIEKAEQLKYYPLSSAQKRIFYTSQMIGDNNIVYNTPGAILINKLLDKTKVENGFKEIINKQSSFRTSFVVVDNDVKQQIHNSIDFVIPTFQNTESDIDDLINNFPKPFSLNSAPLLRVELHYIENKKTLLLLDSHHIIMDGTSLNILINDFCKLYNNENIEDLDIEYKDFSTWENTYLQSDSLKSAEEYWLNKFKDSEIPPLNLPYDFNISSTRNYVGHTVSKQISKELFDKCINLSNKLNISPYTLFVSAFFVLLYKYTGQEEILLGTPTSNRNNEQTQHLIGMFVNNLVLSGKIDSSKKFTDFVEEMKNQILNDLEYQNYPYDLLVKKLEIPVDNSRNPLFDIMFTYQNTGDKNLLLDNTSADILIPNYDIAKFNLSVELNPSNRILNLEYRTDLFKEGTINRFFEHYINALNCIVNNQSVLIKDISIISEEEKNKILYEFNDTKIDYPKNKTLPELFYKIVSKNSKKVAVTHQESSITYSELNKKSNHLSKILYDSGVRSGDVVGVCLNRSLELITSIWAILKLGAIYMPMYVDYPTDRLNYMLENSNAKFLITDKKMNKKINFNNVFLLDSINNLESCNKLKLNEPCSPDSIAYIIYTSGSTGKPKGVQISHRNLINYVYAFNKYFNNDISNKDSFLSSTNISFDVSIFEIFLSILNGANLVLYEEELIKDIISYCESIIKHNITSLYIPPNILNEVYNILKKNSITTIRHLLVGVEPISNGTLNNFLELNPNMAIVNGYGPTETTICCSALKYTYNKNADSIVPIGNPLSNNHIYILDSNKNIQPLGIPGELYVTGDGVGKGYINNEKETAKNYLDNIIDNCSKKMYRTGDLAKWNSDGTISFIGRNDSQVKLSGYRIELNEINNTVIKYPSIIKSFSTIYTKRATPSIITYYTAEKEISKTDLLTFLKSKLATHMVPHFLIQLDAFPLTANGKIDTKNLPLTFITRSNYVKPRNEFEENLAKIFKMLFMLNKVSIDDNFFDLGGDSLTAIKFQTEALNLGLKLTYADIFSYPTIRMLSESKHKKTNISSTSSYDYSKIDELLLKEYEPRVISTEKSHPFNNILLLGATGFLGIHILEQLILSGTKKIYCIIRKKSFDDPESRLKKYLEFYFGTKYHHFIGTKIIVLDGDITNPNLISSNDSKIDFNIDIDCVIHSAALVKHYGDFKRFNDTNIYGTQNVINFCKTYDKKLFYISTLSVSGNLMTSSKEISTTFYKENQFFINQDLNNIYIYTKFEAEKKIFEAMQEGLSACILRIGNITNRYSDGKFQINVSENAFINRLRSIINLGVIQEKFLPHSLEFTPVDICAECIFKILENNPPFPVLHLFNNNFIKIIDLINILHDMEIDIKPVSDNDFSNKISLVLKDKLLKDKINGIIADLTDEKLLNLINGIIPDSHFTNQYLETINFEWPLIDRNYIYKYIEYFKNIKYF